MTLHLLDQGRDAPWKVAVVIPARDEARRIEACLDAARAALDGRGGIVLVVNGSSDETAPLARNWFAATRCPGILLDDVAPPPGSGVGRARRLGLAAARDALADDGVIMTSDADSRVAPDWVSANLDELGHADLVCGLVLPDPGESGALPEIIGTRGAPEGEYEALTRSAMALIDPVPHNPEPAHLNAAGASLAFRANVLDIVPMPDLRIGEDRAFAHDAAAAGLRVRHSARARVVASCRLTGRTGGGMAGALRSRIDDSDPYVDEMLMPAELTFRRARLSAALRAGLPQAVFGPAWAHLEAADPTLNVPRMRLSDLQRELPLLRRAVAALQDRRVVA